MSASTILPTAAFATLGTVTVLLVALIAAPDVHPMVGPSASDGGHSVTVPQLSVTIAPLVDLHLTTPSGPGTTGNLGDPDVDPSAVRPATVREPAGSRSAAGPGAAVPAARPPSLDAEDAGTDTAAGGTPAEELPGSPRHGVKLKHVRQERQLDESPDADLYVYAYAYDVYAYAARQLAADVSRTAEPVKTSKAAKPAKTSKAAKPAKTSKAAKPVKTSKAPKPVKASQPAKVTKAANAAASPH